MVVHVSNSSHSLKPEGCRHLGAIEACIRCAGVMLRVQACVETNSRNRSTAFLRRPLSPNSARLKAGNVTGGFMVSCK